MIFSGKKQPPQELPLILKKYRLKNVKQHKHLGITFTQNMQWTTHIDNIESSATTRIHLMKTVKYKWSRNSLLICYTNFSRPLIEYANVVYANLSIQDLNKLENIQNEAMRIITGAKRLSSNTALLKETGFKTLAKRRKSHKMIVFLLNVFTGNCHHLQQQDVCPLNSNPETHEPHHQSHLVYPDAKRLLLYRVSSPAMPKHTTHTIPTLDLPHSQNR